MNLKTAKLNIEDMYVMVCKECRNNEDNYKQREQEHLTRKLDICLHITVCCMAIVALPLSFDPLLN